jgi:transposase
VCRVALLGPRASRLGHEVRLIPPAYVKPFDGKRTFEKSLSTTALIGAAA